MDPSSCIKLTPYWNEPSTECCSARERCGHYPAVSKTRRESERTFMWRAFAVPVFRPWLATIIHRVVGMLDRFWGDSWCVEGPEAVITIWLCGMSWCSRINLPPLFLQQSRKSFTEIRANIHEVNRNIFFGAEGGRMDTQSELVYSRAPHCLDKPRFLRWSKTESMDGFYRNRFLEWNRFLEFLSRLVS